MRVLGNATSEASRLFSQANPSVRSLKARRERLESGAFVFGTTEPRPSRIGFGLAGGQSDLSAAWLADGSGEMLGHPCLTQVPPAAACGHRGDCPSKSRAGRSDCNRHIPASVGSADRP